MDEDVVIEDIEESRRRAAGGGRHRLYDEKEEEVVKLLKLGFTVREVSHKTGISKSTVHLMGKRNK